MNTKEFLGGLIGTSLSAVGTATQTQEILQIVSLIITIIGGIVSLIIIPILNWYKNAKKDGKISVDELIDGANTLKDGVDALDDKIKGKEDDKHERESGKN